MDRVGDGCGDGIRGGRRAAGEEGGGRDGRTSQCGRLHC
jgi:hypothetical protein